MLPGHPTIEVRYSCSGCGLVDVAVTVGARTGGHVAHWLREMMSRAISRDHARRSPFCKATSMSQVKIPMTGTDKVGGTPIN